MTTKRLALVGLVAAVVRFGFMAWTWTGTTTELDSGLVTTYFASGYALAAGYGYVVGDESPAREHYSGLLRRVRAENIRVTPQVAGPMPQQGWRYETLHPPGISLLVAGANRLLGIRADVPMQVLGLVLDSLAAVLVCWLVGRMLGGRVGLWTGLLYAAFPGLAFIAIAKTPDGMVGGFVVASAVLAYLAANRCGWPAAAMAAAAGAVLGLGSYLRPDYALMPVFVGAGLWAYTRRFFRSLGHAVLMQAMVLLILLPWAYRNHTLCGRWVFTSTSVGATLITGLGEFHNPWGFGYTDKDRAREAAEAGFPTPWGPEADTHFRHLFFKSVAEHPQAYAAQVVKRIPLALAAPQGWGYRNPYQTMTFTQRREAGEDRYQAILRDPLGILAAYWDRLLMGLATLACTVSAVVLAVRERRRWGLVLLLLAPHLYSILTHLLVHVEPRFLLPSFYAWLAALAYVLCRGWRGREELALTSLTAFR